MPSSDSGSTAKVNKHLQLEDAVCHLENAIGSLEALRVDIGNEPTPDTKEPTKPTTQPSLLKVLENTPNEIHNLAKRIEVIVVDIRKQLF
jgi:hypothetical protein